MKVENIKASFLQRFFAYFIDVILVSILASIIAFPFLDVSSINKLEDELVEIADYNMVNKMSFEGVISSYKDIYYQLSIKEGIYSFIHLVLLISYFCFYQYYSGGQTIGKKILHIKVIDIEGGTSDINAFIIRSMISGFILFNMINFCCLLFMKADAFLIVGILVDLVGYLIFCLSTLFLIFSKNKVALHDYLAHTCVVKCIEEENIYA